MLDTFAFSALFFFKIPYDEILDVFPDVTPLDTVTVFFPSTGGGKNLFMDVGIALCSGAGAGAFGRFPPTSSMITPPVLSAGVPLLRGGRRTAFSFSNLIFARSSETLWSVETEGLELEAG